MFYTFFKNKNTTIQKSQTKSSTILAKESEELNTYYHLYSNLVDQNFSVSKLNESLTFYELIELYTHLQINNFKNINIGDFSETECFKHFIEYKISNYNYHLLNYYSVPILEFDILFFNLFIDNPFHIIYTICKYQRNNGYTIIKFTCKNIDFIYLLTTLFTKTIVCRPIVMSNGSEDYYIICQKFNKTHDYDINLLSKNSVTCNTPLHFINYINEIFVLMKQQFLINRKNIFFVKLLNTEKKDATINKNIYNCIKWCETYEIPYNELKINIFNDKL
jgi:hypothetical protein